MGVNVAGSILAYSFSYKRTELCHFGQFYVTFVCTDDVNMEGSFASADDTGSDSVAWSGRLKPFLSYRTRFSALSSVKEHSGSNASLASITGCML